jgi:hypothetical protein
MSEYTVKVYSKCGRVLARFPVVGSYGRAMRAGYERAECYSDNVVGEVVAVRV